MHRTYTVSLAVLGSVLLMMSCQNTGREFDGEQGQSGGGNGGTAGVKGDGGLSGDAAAGGGGTGNAPSTEGGDESGGGSSAGNTSGGSGGSSAGGGGSSAGGGGSSAGGGGSSAGGGGSSGASTAGVSGNGGAATKDNGTACEAASECSSGVCGSEGVCCDEACDGQCESCVSPASRGTCVAVTTPKTPCTGNGTSCGGTCSPTNRNSCVYPSTSTTCAGASCNASGARGPSKCDGGGSCVAPNPTTCVYGCDGTTCATCRQKDSTNLLTNPGFDGAVTSWQGGTFANYSSNDADNCAGSGSFGLDYLNEFSQCVSNVSAGTRYYMGFRFKGWDTTDSHLGYCVVNFYSAANCNGSFFISSFDASATSAGPWATTVTNNEVAPDGTVSMVFACSGSVGHGYYDQLYLGTSSTVRF
jgi:hypothetical protein